MATIGVEAGLGGSGIAIDIVGVAFSVVAGPAVGVETAAIGARATPGCVGAAAALLRFESDIAVAAMAPIQASINSPAPIKINGDGLRLARGG